MRQVHRKGLATVMLTGGALAMATGYAHADSNADGAAVGSPGVLSGNAVQLPVDVPVNVCGNTVNVVGLLNPAAGNSCANGSPSGGGQSGAQSGASHSSGGAVADGDTAGSPGILSGNGVQLPVEVPVNVTGNSVNVVGIGNPADGNTSTNVSGKPPVKAATPPKADRSQKPSERAFAPKAAGGSLAETGAATSAFAASAGAAMVLGGVVLYRRFRPAQV
ncbi:LPXTG-motif cell wall-anchored protein [Streptomyces sp. V4I23]|uniref:chaplin n=1 Tax=Streptomyces sp. V4I23 TaxID=3042282 RepID=UPI002785F907|nr:chaplin [Streptomyces sp. V4I23]MDQ1011453.1 LPXTG-motif cell wall-anchored protein [Streptomyces sp. V4I23]